MIFDCQISLKHVEVEQNSLGASITAIKLDFQEHKIHNLNENNFIFVYFIYKTM